jgi:excisionase family DNA binding protein
MESDFLTFSPGEPHHEELLTVDEIAALLRVPKSWIYCHTRKRGIERLPHIKVGKYLRFVESEVREFVKQNSTRHVS